MGRLEMRRKQRPRERAGPLQRTVLPCIRCGMDWIARPWCHMQWSKVAPLALIVPALSATSVSFAWAASDCSISGTIADWGENSTSYIDLKSGGSCQFPIRLRGTTSSDISQKPSHGKLKRLNISTFEYTAKARFKGSDTFAIKATGQGPMASGTSVVTVHATIK